MNAQTEARWTRGRLLRAAAGGAAALAGGAAIGAHRDDGDARASDSADRAILGVFLLLEQVQAAFYKEAVEAAHLTGELLRYATTTAEQETAHVAFLTDRLGKGARPGPATDFKEAVSSPDRFRDTAIELEEAAIATYIGQGANLSSGLLRDIATLTSVEARQVAWVRDLAGVSPAPRAADPARKAADVTAELRQKGYLR
jgi:Ferritin-like domain